MTDGRLDTGAGSWVRIKTKESVRRGISDHSGVDLPNSPTVFEVQMVPTRPLQLLLLLSYPPPWTFPELPTFREGFTNFH